MTTYKTSAMLTINRLKKEAEAAGAKKLQKTISHDVMLGGKIGSKVSWSMNNKVSKKIFLIKRETFFKKDFF